MGNHHGSKSGKTLERCTLMSTKSWKDIRIDEINAKGETYSPNSEYFEEVYAIYDSKAETYEQFKKEFNKNG